MAHRSMQLQPTTLTSAEDLEREVADIAAMNVEQLRALAEDSRAASARGAFERSDRSRSLIPDPRSGARRSEPGSAAELLVRTPYHLPTRLAMTRAFKCQAAEWLANPGRLDEFHNSL